MDDIKKIIHFVTLVHNKKNSSNRKRVVKTPLDKVTRLKHLLENEKEITDEQARKRIYGNARRSGEKYRKLKSRLKERLVDEVIHHETGKKFKSLYDLSVFTIQRNLLAASTLYSRDNREAAIDLFKPAFQSALYYNHTHLAIYACRFLSVYASSNGKTKEWKHYTDLLNQLSPLYTATLQMEQLSYRVALEALNSGAYSSSSKKLLAQCFRIASKIHSKYQSHLIHIYYFRITYHYLHSCREYHQIISLCKQHSTYLEEHQQFYQPVRAGEFALMEMEAALQLGRFPAGANCAERCEKFFVPYTSPWFVFYEQYFILAMRTGVYLKAMDIFYNDMSPTRYKKLSPIKQERWLILEAYLNFSLPDALPKKQFNLFRFLNEVPLSGKDKAGYNFAVLVAKLILLVNIGDKARLLENDEALKQYLHRYISKKKHPRHFAFGKLLRLLFRNDFQIEMLEEKARPWLTMLKEEKDEIKKLEEMEVIPYETIWDMLKEKCKRLE